MTSGRFRIVLSLVILRLTANFVEAASPGLPFAEDFATTHLRDATGTTSNWSTNEEAVLLKSRGPLYGAFAPGLVGNDITAEEHDTSSLALGDMDGDGDLDLVEGNRNEPCLLYFNDGLTFKGTVPMGFEITSDVRDTRSVAVGDLDGDGDLDVITGNFSGTNRLYLNNGSSFFAVGSDIAADADDTASVALGDLDRDGDLDLVAGNNGTPNRLYLNNGTDAPFDGVTGSGITSDASATNSVALGDLDSDGDLDLVVANFQQPSQVYLNNGTPDPFAGVTAAEFAPNSSDIEPTVALGDMNGDGNLDIVKVGGELIEFDQIYFNNGTTSPFEGVTGVPINSDEDLSFSVAVGDVDCDGDLDIITGNVGLFSDGGKNRLYLNNGTSDPFSDVMGTNLSEDIHHSVALALGDIDEDGDLDAIAGNRNQRNRLYLSEGTSNPFDEGTEITPTSIVPYDLAVGDVDGDGDNDLLLTNGLSGGFTRLLLNNGTGTPFMGMVPSEIATDATSSEYIEMQDFNGDGRLDLAISSSFAPVHLYLNNGSAEPFAGVQGNVISSTTSFRAELTSGDLDKDGDVDLVASAPFRDSVFLNNGSSDPFAGVTPSRIGFATESFSIRVMELGDLDRDGDPDLVIGTGPGRLNRFYLNNGTSEPYAGVAGSALGTETGQTTSVVVRDMDRDGNLDILTSSRSSSNVGNLLYLNNGSGAPFTGVSPIRIGSLTESAQYLAIGDIDTDGDPDIAITNGGVGNRFFLNDGTSIPFDGVESIPIPSDTNVTDSIGLADFDRDGDLDFVVGGANGRHGQLHLNNSLHDPFNHLVPRDITNDDDLTRSVIVGDVDRDGDPDVVAGNFGQPNRLYLNNGKMDPFEGAAGTDITPDAQQTTAVALSDLDKDGDLDLIAGNSSQPNRFYPNNGGAAPFEGVTGVNITADSDSTTSVALGDIDRDGDEDMVAGNFGQTNRMYLNNGSSEPWTGVTGVDITEDAHNTNSVALGDVDRDGFLDLVTGDFGQPNRLYINNLRKGFFDRGNRISLDESSVFHAAIGDMDGDEDLDLVVAVLDSLAGNRNRLYLNNGTAHPFEGVIGSDITSDASSSVTVALGDVDGDGDQDIVTGNFGEFVQNQGFLGAPCRLYLNNGTPDPFAGVIGKDIGSAKRETNSVVLGDLDGDQDLDLVEGNRDAPSLIYLNNGTLDPFDGVEGVAIPGDLDDTVSLALGDFDGDGDLDILAGKSSGPSPLYINNGTTDPFSDGLARTADLEGYFAGSVAVGDIDRDGDLDIAIGKPSSLVLEVTPRIFLNNGSADPFAAVAGMTVSGEARTTVSVALGDVDGDGDLDLIEGNYKSNNRLYLNSGTQDPFSAVTGIDIAESASSKYVIALGDFDGDDDLDLVEANYYEPSRVYLNKKEPNPVFAEGADITPDADNTNSVAIGDLDLDGHLDVVAGNFNQPNRVYLNNGTDAPFEGVIGSDAGVGASNTEEITLADVNQDGRLDLVTGNLGQPNRVYLNFSRVVGFPFAGAEGIDITSDADNTRSVVAFDMDRDGSLDIVAGNDGQPNRLYTRRRFNTSSGIATSLTVDTQPGDIHRIILDTEQSLPPNTSIDYWVSSNGGLRWSLVHPAEIFVFPNPSSDLRWRAELKSLSPLFSPRLETLFLDLAPGIKADPAGVDFMTRVPNTGASNPTTVTLSNEGDMGLTVSSVLLSGPDAGEFVFSNDSGEINLSPGAARTFDIAFNPTSLGPKTAAVTIASDDIDRPIVTVEIMGTGVEAPTPTFTRAPTNTPTGAPSSLPTPTGPSTPAPSPTETCNLSLADFDLDDSQVIDAPDLLVLLKEIQEGGSAFNLDCAQPSDAGDLFELARRWRIQLGP